MNNSDYGAALSEHWLHTYNLHNLYSINGHFHFFARSSPNGEDPFFCQPRYLRGHGQGRIQQVAEGAQAPPWLG